MDRVRMRVSGMVCGGCASKVMDAVLGACDRSEDVEADPETGILTFLCGCPENIPRIAAAIEDAGYQVGDA